MSLRPISPPERSRLDRRQWLAGAGLGALALAAGALPAAAQTPPPASPPPAGQAPPPDQPAAPATPPLAFVMNSGVASVAVIDMTTRKVLRDLPVLREPSHWALTPDRARLLVCDAGGNALFSFDPRTAKPIAHQVMADPYQIGFSPDGRYFIANALRLNFIDIYGARDMRLVKRLRLGAMPSHLDFTPDSRWSFHSMQQTGTVVSLDLATLKPRWATRVGSTPAGVLWLGGRVLCCVMGTHDVVVIDPVSGRIEQRVPTGIGPHNLFLAPDKSTLYVTNRVGGTIVALDPASLRVRRTYDMHAAGPDDMGIAPDGKLWVSLRFREQVAVLDPASGQYETIDVGRSPHGIFLNTMLAQPGRITAEIL